MSIKSIKSIKNIKNTKSTKRQTSDFLFQNVKSQNVKQVTFFLLDVFYEHKKNKASNKRTSDFLSLRCFLLAQIIKQANK